MPTINRETCVRWMRSACARAARRRRGARAILVALLLIAPGLGAAIADYAEPSQDRDAEWTLPAMAVERVAMEAILAPLQAVHETRTVRVRRGETLDGVLNRLGVRDHRERHHAVRALGDVFDPRTLQAGQELTVYLERQDRGARLSGLAVAPDAIQIAQVSRTGAAADAFQARTFEAPVTRRITRAVGEVRRSLYVDAVAAGVPHAGMARIADLLAFAVDFQREIHPGDPFEILFEEWVTADGESVRMGDLLYVGFAPRGEPLAYWRHVRPDGGEGFYDADGRSARRMLMRTPINGARLSSPFGPRRHPISGYRRDHKGTDFAAPIGTPIYAAGDGVVERADWYGGYGRYIRLRHANEYQTAYAHMSRFARGMRPGKRVRQGDIIGYVGTSGASTGPHLHYEVIKRGKHVNPMRLKGLTGTTLPASQQAAFAETRAAIDALRAAPRLRPSVAPDSAPSLLASAMAPVR